MGNLVSRIHSLLTLIKSVFEKNTTSSHVQLAKSEIIRLAPIVVKWLQAASNQLGLVEPGEESLVELLQSAFRTGDIKKIYRLSNEVDGALNIILTVSKYVYTRPSICHTVSAGLRHLS